MAQNYTRKKSFTHLRFWPLSINGLQRRFYTMPFFRYAKAIFNEQNESEIGNEKSGHF